jgi:hypothetical protein
MSISSTGRSGLRGRLRLAARQVIGRHRIAVISQSGATQDGRFAPLTARTAGLDREGRCRDCVVSAVSPDVDINMGIAVPIALAQAVTTAVRPRAESCTVVMASHA